MKYLLLSMLVAGTALAAPPPANLRGGIPTGLPGVHVKDGAYTPQPTKFPCSGLRSSKKWVLSILDEVSGLSGTTNAGIQ